jgi:pimeloyl-ACP methyl ester carboxylesterase
MTGPRAFPAETILLVNGVNLCVQTFGDPADPAILLIAGAASSMLWWDAAFCARLVAGPRFVIRYDLRDTGRSVTYEPGTPPYAAHDLAADALGLLDALGLAHAHLVGISMGGGLAQRLARTHPDRVATLTLIATSPGGPGLSPMSEDFLASASAPAPDWSDRDAAIDYLVDQFRLYAGHSRPFAADAMRDLAARDYDRTRNIASAMTNHYAMPSSEPSLGAPATAPPLALVIHGTEDPLFALDHAHALARKYPGAQLVVLDGVGHELPPDTWDVAADAILRHTSA